MAGKPPIQMPIFIYLLNFIYEIFVYITIILPIDIIYFNINMKGQIVLCIVALAAVTSAQDSLIVTLNHKYVLCN